MAYLIRICTVFRAALETIEFIENHITELAGKQNIKIFSKTWVIKFQA